MSCMMIFISINIVVCLNMWCNQLYQDKDIYRTDKNVTNEKVYKDQCQEVNDMILTSTTDHLHNENNELCWGPKSTFPSSS